MLIEDAHLHFNQEQILSSINASPLLYLLHEFIHTPFYLHKSPPSSKNLKYLQKMLASKKSLCYHVRRFNRSGGEMAYTHA